MEPAFPTGDAQSATNQPHMDDIIQPPRPAEATNISEPHPVSFTPNTVLPEVTPPVSSAVTEPGHVRPPLDNSQPMSDMPVPVVQALSVRGVEYTMMTLLLWFTIGGLITILLSIINGDMGFSVLSVPLAILIISFPGFAALYVRLRRAELRNPELRLDPSKRRLSQFTQIIMFAVCVFNLIGFMYLVLQNIGGEASGSLLKSGLSVLSVLLISGGVLVYYWFDEHKLVK